MGQLRSVTTSGSNVEYLFDGENKRIGRKLNGAVTNYWLYDSAGRLAAELNSNGTLKSRFVYGVQSHSPDFMIQNGQNYLFIKDHVGSILAVVNTITNQAAQTISYNEFGLVTFNSNPGFQPFGFAGGHYDHSTGLVRFGVRDYDASTGRWTAKDPILFGGKQSNLYIYVNNDPVNLIDPSGLVVQFGYGAGILAGSFAGGLIAALAEINKCGKADTGKVADEFIKGAIAGGLAGLGAQAGLVGALIGQAVGILGGIAYGPDSASVNYGEFVKGLQTINNKSKCDNKKGKCD